MVRDDLKNTLFVYHEAIDVCMCVWCLCVHVECSLTVVRAAVVEALAAAELAPQTFPEKKRFAPGRALQFLIT